VNFNGNQQRRAAGEKDWCDVLSCFPGNGTALMRLQKGLRPFFFPPDSAKVIEVRSFYAESISVF
jgi:hypothetical protein